MPTSWWAARCRCHQSRALPGAGSSAPPDRVPAPNSPRAATTAATSRAVNTQATGLVTRRASRPVSSGRFCASVRHRAGLRGRGGGVAGAPGRGHVTGLEHDGAADVADEVEAVPVGHPRRGEQVPHLPGRGRSRRDAGRGGRRAPARAAGRRATRPASSSRASPGARTRSSPSGPQEAAEEEPDHHERQAPGRAVDEQRVDRRGPLAPAVARRLDLVRRGRRGGRPRRGRRPHRGRRPCGGRRGPPASRGRCRCRTAGAACRSRVTRARSGGPASRRCSPRARRATRSCWPWSYSPRSRPVSRRPVPLTVTPTSSSRRSEGHSRILGPRMSADGVVSATASSCSSASGAGLLSSWSSQTHSSGRWWRGGRRARRDRGAVRAGGGGVEQRGVRERARAAAGGSRRCCRCRPPGPGRVSGSGRSAPSRTAGSQREPSWLTSSAVTLAPCGAGGRVVTADHPSHRSRHSKNRHASRSATPLRDATGQTARFFSLRRSRSDSPPQMPKRSS